MAQKEAILLLNMGGPNNLDEVELFLKNMFNDKNILTMKSDLLRSFVAQMIVFMRTEKAQEVYRELGGKSPIVSYTKKLIKKVQERVGDEVFVDYVMRYTPPFSSEVIQKLEDKKIEKIYLIPLYPQYSSTTTKSSLEDFENIYHTSNLNAILIEKKYFFQNQMFNKAIIEKIKEAMINEQYNQFDLIFSAHGLPQKIVDRGDLYQQHIHQHIDILKTMLQEEGMFFHSVHLAYQSKVGPMKWLEPSLEEKLQALSPKKKVLIYPIAFIIDNSETKYELDIEYKEVAQELGYETYKVASCVNDSDLFVDAIIEMYDEMKQ
ncbi:Ferrochelatase, protoheme ferro-lyase [hydrothermal vent metagenome]|uniref:Ferrochelatase, protoheme ferro-lyase n=1 Tax=hydrothermal vent metagenome TaxID=652676 RepID=A0A1W1D4Q3_9ZZZZ